MWGGTGSTGLRKVIWPATKQLTADDWVRAALRQYKFGCDKISLHCGYFRNALRLDPHNIQANLLLGEAGCDEDKNLRMTYLETVVAYADPESLEYAQAKKLLAGEHWTFAELCRRIGPDGILR